MILGEQLRQLVHLQSRLHRSPAMAIPIVACARAYVTLDGARGKGEEGGWAGEESIMGTLPGAAGWVGAERAVEARPLGAPEGRPSGPSLAIGCGLAALREENA